MWNEWCLMTAKVNLGPACLVFCVALIGCNNANREQELREQKLLVELAKTNTDRLAELSRKEQNLMGGGEEGARNAGRNQTT